MATDKSKRFILWFNEIGIEDIPMVGGKNASLGRCIKNSTTRHQHSNGFAITAYAYRYF